MKEFDLVVALEMGSMKVINLLVEQLAEDT